MKVSIKQLNNSAYFEGKNETGHSILIHSPFDQQEALAPSPMETLLMAAASCSSVDVVLILEKMKEQLDNLEVQVNGERSPKGDSKPFHAISLHFILHGTILERKAERAVKLSVEKYCSVMDSLHPDIDINWSFEIIS